MPILMPIIILAVIAILCAVLLTVSNIFFGVKENELVAAVREELPGANCGACGFSGCDGYAKALGEGKVTKTNLCTAGGDGVAKRLAAVMGVEAEDVVEMVAYVACNGSCQPDEKKYEYVGPKTCVAANMAFAGDRKCTFACLGYGDCMAVCPRGAIHINERNVAEIDPQKCIGCGLCERTCPNHIIHVVPDTIKTVIMCSNHNKGIQVKNACANGCLACGLCAKVCPEGAITMVNNLPVIDHSKCTGCGLCKNKCPVKCIHQGNFKCGAHFE